jgi:hypothetical protein
MLGTDLQRFLTANAIGDFAGGLSASALTFLVLSSGGVTDVALVQSAPLAVNILAAPLLGAVVDRRSARTTASAALAGLAALTVGYLWLELTWLAALATAAAGLAAAYGATYARLLPALAAPARLDRVIGAVSAGTGVVRAAAVMLGPLLAHAIGGGAFVVAAALYAGAASLVWTLPPATAAPAPGARGGGPAAPPAPARGGAARRPSPPIALLLALWMGASWFWGVEQVLALRVASDHLALPAAWSGAYLSASALGSVAGALALSAGLWSSTGAVAPKVGVSLALLGASAAGILVTANAPLALALKLVEGAAGAVLGLLCQAAVVLRADPIHRGRRQGALAACGALALLAGKVLTSALAGALSPAAIYGGVGAALALAAAIATALALRRARRARARAHLATQTATETASP